MRFHDAAVDNKFAQLRQITLYTFNASIEKELNLTAILIDDSALAEYDKWVKNPERKEDFDWRSIVKNYKALYPKRFEIALWQMNELMSLSVGRPSFSAAKMRLDIIEGAPSRNKNIKVFPLMLGAYYIYAKLLNADEVRVMNPVNEDVRNYYVRQGSVYVKNGDYCVFKVDL